MNTNKHPLTARDSNIELLRLICMFMVLLMHFYSQGCSHGLSALQYGHLYNIFGHAVDSLCLVAVDCFVLISGYFGINFKFKGLFRLYLDCFFIGLISYLSYLVISPDAHLGLYALFGRFLAFSHNHWWFIISYLELFFLSPVLNLAVNLMSKKAHLIITVLYTLSCVIFDHFGKEWLPLFISLYLIGRYIGRYVDMSAVRRKRWLWLLSYLSFSVCTCLLFVLHDSFPDHKIISRIIPYDYYSIFIISAALSFLLFSLSFSFKSRVINWLANSAFCAYLMQESPYFGRMILYPWCDTFFTSIDSGLLRFGYLMVISLSFLIVSVCVGNLIKFLYKPLSCFFNERIENKLAKYYVWDNGSHNRNYE